MKTWVATLVASVCLAGCGANDQNGRFVASTEGDPGETSHTPAPDLLTTGISAGATDAATGTTSSSDDSTSAASEGAAPEIGIVTPVRIVVLSDLNDSYGSTTYATTVHRAVERVVELDPDLVLSTGDMVAGQQAALDYTAMWAGFHAAVSDPLAAAGLPFAVTPGNHDGSSYPEFAGERAIFIEQWQARKPDLEYLDDSSYPLRYSFVMGPALFVSLDATEVGPLDGAQMAWLDAQLQAGADMPVKIVYGHLPLLPFASGRETEILGDPELDAMLQAHAVTLFISGHHHAYYPGRRGTVRHVSMACLGAGPRALIGSEAPSPRSLLLLEIDEDGAVTSLEALSGENYDAPVLRESLPESISYGEWTLDRDDMLVPAQSDESATGGTTHTASPTGSDSAASSSAASMKSW